MVASGDSLTATGFRFEERCFQSLILLPVPGVLKPIERPLRGFSTAEQGNQSVAITEGCLDKDNFFKQIPEIATLVPH
jgi:hypothetical protein